MSRKSGRNPQKKGNLKSDLSEASGRADESSQRPSVVLVRRDAATTGRLTAEDSKETNEDEQDAEDTRNYVGSVVPEQERLASIIGQVNDVTNAEAVDPNSLPEDPDAESEGEDEESEASEESNGDMIKVNYSKVQLEDGVDQVLMEEFKATDYDGFNIFKCRKKFYGYDSITEVRDKEIGVKIVRCLIAYTRVGNNISKIGVKSKDIITSNRLKQDLARWQISNTAANSDSLTLSRIVICYLPVYLMLRKCVLSEGLQDQTTSTIDLLYKDIAFCADEGIYNMVGYKEFHDQFNNLIKKKKRDKDGRLLDNEDRSDWIKVAQDGFKSDSLVMRFMEVAKRDVNVHVEMKDVIRFATKFASNTDLS